MSDPATNYSSDDELPVLQLLLEQSLVMKGREITPNQSLPPASLFDDDDDPVTPPRETTRRSQTSKVPKIAAAGTTDITSRRLPKEVTATTAKKQIRRATTTAAVAGRQKKWDGGHVEAVTSTTPAVEDDSDYASAVEEVIPEPTPAPRRRRRLVQKKYLPSSDDDSDKEQREVERPRRGFVDLTGSDSEDAPSQLPRTQSQAPQAEATVPQAVSSGYDIESFTLRYSPPRSTKPRKIIPPAALKAEEAPTPARKLKSPTKLLPKMPSSQHRKSSDAFWDQEITDNWIDNHTPYKARGEPVSSRGHDDIEIITEKGGDSDGDDDDIVEADGDDSYGEDSEEERAPSPTKRIPAVKSNSKEESAVETKRAFNARKKQLAEDFFKTIDEKIGKGEISQKTAATGGVKIIWSKTLRTTAGTAKWRAEKLQNISDHTATEHPMSTTRVRHHATIELAEKVVDSQEKLYNTMCHEYCHMANYMISNVTKPAHGPDFKRWAAKCTREFSHLGVHVTTKHSYEIDAKFKWTCQTPSCGQVYKRHSKSIDITRSRCGACKTGMLLQTHPPLREKRPITGYQAFMKENFARIKAQNPGVPQRDIMKIVAHAYRDAKETGAAEASGENEGDLDVMLGELKV